MVNPEYNSHRFCVAPMMDWTDRHCRYFMRLITKHARLYTEMVTTAALIHGDTERYLRFDPLESPLALQLGGSSETELAHCARLASQHGFAEVNLNVGCPSDRVQNGRFGACLMAEPELVANCVSSMIEAVDIPVTVKCRIGIDHLDSAQYLQDFIGTVRERGCNCFIIHARIAVLNGLSPKQNREIPPLDYSRVFAVKHHFPDLKIVINGGINNMEAVHQMLEQVDGVMVGREAYQNPYFLADVDTAFYDSETEPPTRIEIMNRMLPYIERTMSEGAALNHITRHLLGLFQGQAGARRFRRYLSENAHLKNAGTSVIKQAVAQVIQ